MGSNQPPRNAINTCSKVLYTILPDKALGANPNNSRTQLPAPLGRYPQVFHNPGDGSLERLLGSDALNQGFQLFTVAEVQRYLAAVAAFDAQFHLEAEVFADAAL